MATQTKKRKKKKGSKASLILLLTLLAVLLIAIITLVIIYFKGKSKYEGKFLANTFINGTEVSGKTLDEVKQLFISKTGSDEITVTRRDGNTVTIPYEAIDFKLDADEQIDLLFKKQDPSGWYSGLLGRINYTVTEGYTFNKDKLRQALINADWGSVKNKDAEIVRTDSGYVINDAVQGDELDKLILASYVISGFEKGTTQFSAMDANCYLKPQVQAEDLKQELEELNKIFKLSITYDFDYTTETLDGQKLLDMITINDDKTVTADPDKCMKYVEELAAKYDTFKTSRKFHTTKRGDITVPQGEDGKYGWWIWQQKTCDELVEMLEKGETVKSVKPVYYEEYGYAYTCLPENRSAESDIGSTYLEIDLTAQHMWFYDKGKMAFECDIVSGLPSVATRRTLPGVYKLWFKGQNHRLKDSSPDGSQWDVTVAYWNNISLIGVGIHDATWQPYFGGQLYKSNGSHGCINVSLASAKYIFENVPLNAPVVMYD